MATPGETLRGCVVYLYSYDVAYEIVTARVRRILSKEPSPFMVRVDRTSPKDVPLVRPLVIEPPALDGMIAGQKPRVLVRVYDVGVVTISVQASIAVEHVNELLPFHCRVFDDGRALDAVVHELCMAACRSLRPYLVRPTTIVDPEPYTIFGLTELVGAADALSWLAAHQREIAGLLAETPGERLSDSQVNETLRLARSFEKSDLVIIDWDAALAIDLGGYVDDVLYVLELADLQLEEFRAMDRELDQYLERAYVDLEGRRWPMFGRARRVLAELRRFRVDLTRLADEVTHITKFLGDWHLARVYLAARERFYLDQWRTSLEGRLSQLDQLYSVAQAESYERRMFWLEVIVVIFFAIDLLAIFLGKH